MRFEMISMVPVLSLLVAMSAICSGDAYTTRELFPNSFGAGEIMHGTTRFRIATSYVVECEES
jgi:threonine/homoserine efflux transporter RhtA